jgi:hypothetical protein
MTKKVIGNKNKIDFDDWIAMNQNSIDCEVAESGMDREMDFDREAFEFVKYNEYLDSL